MSETSPDPSPRPGEPTGLLAPQLWGVMVFKNWYTITPSGGIRPVHVLMGNLLLIITVTACLQHSWADTRDLHQPKECSRMHSGRNKSYKGVQNQFFGLKVITSCSPHTCINKKPQPVLWNLRKPCATP